MKFLASIQNEADHRALIIAIVILVVLFFIIGLIGMGIRALMGIQTKRIETAMADVTKTHVIQTPAEFRKLAIKKSNRMLYRDTLIPFLLSFIGLLIWTIGNLVYHRWSANIFVDFQDLFFSFDWGAEGVIVKVFGLPLIGQFPPVSHHPEFILDHLCNYIAVAFFLVSWVYYFVVCQAFLSRLYALLHLSRTVFEKNLTDYHADDEDTPIPQKPLPPSE